MTHESTALPTWSTLTAAVGNFLYHWSILELGLRDATSELLENTKTKNRGIRGTFDARLRRWAKLAAEFPVSPTNADNIEEVCHQALHLKHARNLIVHGWKGGTAVGADDSFIECAVGGYDAPTGETVQYTLAQLEHLTQAVDATRRAFVDLRYFNYRL